jgi:hypothetical protein
LSHSGFFLDSVGRIGLPLVLMGLGASPIVRQARRGRLAALR